MDQNSKSYIIPRQPVPLRRGRVNYQVGVVYDDQKEHKNNVRLLLRKQHGSAPMFKGPLKLAVTFYFGRLDPQDFYHTYIPDLSNLIKMVEDIGTGILYEDDCLIAEITAVKCYSTSSRTEFTITELAKGESNGNDTVPKPTEY